jgi:hypothetical protein
MIKGLLMVDNSSVSSIALQYAERLSNIVPIHFKAVHIEQEQSKKRVPGTGWVEKTWRNGIEHAGFQKACQLINKENVRCNFIGSPKVFIGNRCDNLLNELWNGCYELFLEGSPKTTKVNEFHELITSRLYSKSPSPMLVIKNLVEPSKAVLIIGDGVDIHKLVPTYLKLTRNAKLTVDILTYKFQENDVPVFMDKVEGGSAPEKTEKMLAVRGCKVSQNLVVSGAPEKVAELFRDYGLAFSTFPSRKSPRLELLAHLPTPLVLCR